MSVDIEWYDLTLKLLGEAYDELYQGIAPLDTTQSGYSIVTSNLIPFFVSVDNIEPYLDGHRIILKIGNPMNVTFNGFTADLRWGKQRPNDMSSDDWENTLRQETFEMVDHLKAGSWNKVRFTLPDTPADEMRYVDISLKVNRLSLYE